MPNLDYINLNHMQIGRYGEYYAKMEFASYGFEVFTSEVDDRGVDFLVMRKGGAIYQVQVKSVRDFNYIFFVKDKFKPDPHLLAVIVIFQQLQLPTLYLIPSIAWLEPDALLVSRDYEGKKSKPEWGINFSVKNQPRLDQFLFSKMAGRLDGIKS